VATFGWQWPGGSGTNRFRISMRFEWYRSQPVSVKTATTTPNLLTKPPHFTNKTPHFTIKTPHFRPKTHLFYGKLASWAHFSYQNPDFPIKTPIFLLKNPQIEAMRTCIREFTRRGAGAMSRVLFLLVKLLFFR
jgi:hypothetical protein